MILMANIVLHASNLLDAAYKIEDAANRIDKALQSLDSTMSDIDAVWNDENSKKYLARYAELKQEFPGFKDAIHGYSTFLNTVVEAYRKEFVEPTSSSVK